MRRLLVATLIAPFLIAPFASAAAGACARVPQDFNGDGYGDLAVGAPRTYEPVSDVNWQGAVHWASGSPSGFSRPFTLTGSTEGLPYGKFVGSSQLGEALASGYFDGDCYADLAVSAAPGSSLLVLYGSPTGLGVERSAHFDRESIQPGGAYGTNFGHDLAAGDFNGDGFDDVAGGAPYADGDKGAFGVLYGSDQGIAKAGAQWISQDSPGVPGAGERDDVFGWTLAAGDFNGDGKDDLAVGARGEAIGSLSGAGGLIVFSGTTAGLATSGSIWWDQNSAGVPGVAERGDLFSERMAAGDTDNDGKDELIVSSPTEGIGRQNYAGMIHTFRGTARGLAVGPAFDQDSPRIPGAAEEGDYFGSALGLADLNRDGRLDIAVGVPGESVGSWSSSGAINILPSAASGPSDTGATFLDQNSPGIPGSNETNDSFGTALGRVPKVFGGDVLIIGAPFEQVRYPGDGAVTVLPSAARGTARRDGVFISGGAFPGGNQKDASFGQGLPG